MTNYAIIENEEYSLQNLKSIVERLRPDYKLVFTAESVEETVDWLLSSPRVDLIFLDIELVDGNCFEIFDHVKVTTPIIFTTAYDTFALEAFKVNSVDYLLKPITDAAVQQALDKLERVRPATDYNHLASTMQARTQRPRILTSSGDSYSYVSIDDVAFFVSEDKYVFVYTRDGKRHITDYPSLGELMTTLDAQSFFQLARNMITSITAITGVNKYFNGRLKVTVTAGNEKQTATVSAARKRDFLNWLGGDQ